MKKNMFSEFQKNTPNVFDFESAASHFESFVTIMARGRQ